MNSLQGQDIRPIKITSPSFFLGKTFEGLISFGAGQPDLLPPESVTKIASEREDFYYGPIQGSLDLRGALAKKYNGYNLDHFVITNGGSEALDLIFRSIVLKRDQKSGKPKILLPKPYYYSYIHLARMAGLEIDYYTLIDGKVDLNSFRDQIKGCSIVLTNSPSNPLGSVQSDEVLLEIESLIEKEGAFLVADEVYRELLTEKPVAYRYENTVVIDSFSKTFCMCGARVGYLYSKNKDLIESIVDMKTHTSMNTSNFSQRLALAALNVDQHYVEKQRLVWKERRDFFYKRMLSMGLEPIKPEGAFYLFLPLKQASRAVVDLFEKHRLVVYDGKWFGAPDLLRFSYALDIKVMEQGIARFEKFLKNDYVHYQ